MKYGKEVSRHDNVYVSGNYNISNVISDNLPAIAEFLGYGAAALFTGDPTLAAKAGQEAIALANSVGAGSSKSFGLAQAEGYDEDFPVDELTVWFHAWSDDDLKDETCKVVFAPPQANKFAEQRPDTKHYDVGWTIPLYGLPSGPYVFSAGAQDRGWAFDVAVFAQLTINIRESRIYGGAAGGTTDVAPAVTAWKDRVFLFCKGIDDKAVYLNQAAMGEKYGGWQEIQGDGHTDAALAATAWADRVFVFGKGIDDRAIYLNQAAIGQAFGGWQEIQGGGRTDVAVAATSLNGRVYVFAKGDGEDRAIYINEAVIGQAFGGWLNVQGEGQTDVAPAAAALGDRVFVFVKGLDSRVYLNQAQVGQAFGGWQEVPGDMMTDVPVAATSFRNRILVFAKRSNDARIFFNQAIIDQAFEGWQEV